MAVVLVCQIKVMQNILRGDAVMMIPDFRFQREFML